ncbi:COMM domain-containing protein 10 [Serinus canaria]|nr:COMM domain-containing protein 10 [Serinus canaria]
MSFSAKFTPCSSGFVPPSLRAARRRLALPGRRRGRARVAAMAAPIVPESDSIRRAVSLLNAVDPGRFPRLLSRLLQKLHLKAESTFSEEEEEKLQIAFSLEKQDLHLVLETISFILEQAVYHNLKPASLQQQLQSIHLDQDKAEAFASAWAAAGQETIEKFRQRVLTPQKLETVGWQLNLQMAESMQAKLKSPQAVLELGVSNEDSKNLKKVFVEFSHQELFEFYNKLETIQAQLDSLM